LESNNKAPGYDIARPCAQRLQRAQNTGDPAMTAPITLVQACAPRTQRADVLRIAVPLPPNEVTERQQRLIALCHRSGAHQRPDELRSATTVPPTSTCSWLNTDASPTFAYGARRYIRAGLRAKDDLARGMTIGGRGCN
jgi:hypothetical protein